MKIINKSLCKYNKLFWFRNIIINYNYLLFYNFNNLNSNTLELLRGQLLGNSDFIGFKYINNIKHLINMSYLENNSYILIYFNKFINIRDKMNLLITNDQYLLYCMIYKGNIINNVYYTKIFLYYLFYNNNYNTLILYMYLLIKVLTKIIWKLKQRLLISMIVIKKIKKVNII
jgi:hypothetical protein